MIAISLSIILGVIITVITYFRTVVSVKKIAEVHFHKINTGIHKLLWYPAVLFIVFLPTLVDHIAHTIDPTDKRSLVFLIPHAAITHSIGFTNAIIYGLQKGTSDYKPSETIISLDGGTKRVDMTKLLVVSDSS